MTDGRNCIWQSIRCISVLYLCVLPSAISTDKHPVVQPRGFELKRVKNKICQTLYSSHGAPGQAATGAFPLNSNPLGDASAVG